MLQITDLTFSAWGRKFLDDASVSLPPGSKVGLVGRNGIGKSTLFKLILGELAAGGDEITLPKTARVASVDQEHPATPVSVLETILEADVERHDLLTRLETAEPEEMGEIWTRLIEIDADAAPARAAEILVGLEDGLQHADGRGRVLLVDRGHPRGFGQGDLVAAGRQLAEDQLEQRGLADSVAADQPDLGAGRQADRGVVEEFAAPGAEGQVGDLEHGGR